MWNKPKEDFATRQQPDFTNGNTPQPVAPHTPARVQPNTPQTPALATATIGPSMHIKGEIRSREELLVDGDVEGSLESESLLTVGENGKVRANIKAREVVIFGSVHGDVIVTDKIVIREQGSLIGNIKCAGIGIDDGAYFKGSIDIVRPDPKTTAKTVQSEPKLAVPVN